MYLFGGKFCMWADRSRPCTCAEVVSRHPMCRCDRKHFNDIIWALVTVFQVPLFPPLLTLYITFCVFLKATYTYIYVAVFRHVFLRIYTVFPLPICVHVLSLFLSLYNYPRRIYISIYISSCWANLTCDPSIPQVHLRFVHSCLFVVRAERRSLLMVALYLHACNGIYVYIHVDIHQFARSRRSNCATMTPPTSVLQSQFSLYASSMWKQLMCTARQNAARTSNFLPFYHVFPFTSVLDAVRLLKFIAVQLIIVMELLAFFW